MAAEDFVQKQQVSGFTLIELLVAMVVATILMGMVASSYWAQTVSSRSQREMVGMQQDLRTALYFLKRDFMMAGYDAHKNDQAVPPGTRPVPPWVTLTGVDANGNATVRFLYNADNDGVDNDGDGITDELDEMETVHYELYDSGTDADTDEDDLRRSQVVPNNVAIAGNIEEMEFFYTLNDGTQPAPGTVLADPDDIRAVGISLLVRTERETTTAERSYYSSRVYTTLGGQNWGPYNDGRQRRLLCTTVQCRNMVGK